LVAPDEPGARVPHDPLGAPQMVEVRVADDDPVAGVHGVGRQPRAGRARNAIDVRVEEHRQARGAQAKGRAAVPIERRHATSATSGYHRQARLAPPFVPGRAGAPPSASGKRTVRSRQVWHTLCTVWSRRTDRTTVALDGRDSTMTGSQTSLDASKLGA